jgi:hypothetical protein
LTKFHDYHQRKVYLAYDEHPYLDHGDGHNKSMRFFHLPLPFLTGVSCCRTTNLGKRYLSPDSTYVLPNVSMRGQDYAHKTDDADLRDILVHLERLIHVVPVLHLGLEL